MGEFGAHQPQNDTGHGSLYFDFPGVGRGRGGGPRACFNPHAVGVCRFEFDPTQLLSFLSMVRPPGRWRLESSRVSETRRRAPTPDRGHRPEDTAGESPRASDNTPAQLTRDQPNTCHHRLHELQTLAPRRMPPEPGGARSRGAERSWRRGRPHRSSQRSACRRRRSRTGLAAAPAGAAPRARVPAAAAWCRLLGVAPPWRGRSEAAQPRAP